MNWLESLEARWQAWWPELEVWEAACQFSLRL